MLKRIMGRSIVCAGMLLLGGQCVMAEVVGVSEDAKVYKAYPTTSYPTADLTVGYYQNENRFYLKFELPDYVPGTEVSSALLKGFYFDDTYPKDVTQNIYSVSDDTWSETTLNWNNQPDPSSWTYLTNWNPASSTEGSWVSWDIADAVDMAYKGDGTLSLVFAQDIAAQYSTEWFHSKEFSDGDYKFSIDMQTAAVVTPEPASMVLFGLGGAAMAFARRRIKAKV